MQFLDAVCGAHIFIAVVSCTKTETAAASLSGSIDRERKNAIKQCYIFHRKKNSRADTKNTILLPSNERKERQLEDLCNLMLKRIDATPGVFFLHNAKTHFGRRTNNIQWNMFIVAANDQGSRHPLSSTANRPSCLFLFWWRRVSIALLGRVWGLRPLEKKFEAPWNTIWAERQLRLLIWLLATLITVILSV